jgi:hypothetical protein
LVVGIPNVVACGGAIEEDASAEPTSLPSSDTDATCNEPSPTAATLRVHGRDAEAIYPLQLAAGGGQVFLGVGRVAPLVSPELGLILGLRFDDAEVRPLTEDYRLDYSLIASGRSLVYFSATGPAQVTKSDGGTFVGSPPGEWVARDRISGTVRRLGMKSYGTGVALRDGTFAIVATGEDGAGPAEVWSWDPATNRIDELLTASFTDGRVPILATDGVDLFVEDDGTPDRPTWRIWKIDMAAKSAIAVHDEDYRGPPAVALFLGADRDALYFFDQSPPTLHTFTKTGDEVSSVALDLNDGNTPGDHLPPMAFGGVTESMIYLTSTSRQTMVQIDKRSGASLARTPAPTTESIYAYAADACYVYFSSGDVVSRVPRVRAAAAR